VAAIEEHKPVEKRRALGRGLDSLLPSGPRVVAAAPTTAVAPMATPPVVIPAAVAPVIAEPGPELVPTPGEIAEIYAARETNPLKPKPGLSGPSSSGEASRAGAPAPHGQGESS